jgi:hypothetical protein
MRCAPPFSFLHHAGPEKADIYRPPARGFGVFGWLQVDTVAAVWTAATAIHREKNTVEAAAAAGLQPQQAAPLRSSVAQEGRVDTRRGAEKISVGGSTGQWPVGTDGGRLGAQVRCGVAMDAGGGACIASCQRRAGSVAVRGRAVACAVPQGGQKERRLQVYVGLLDLCYYFHEFGYYFEFNLTLLLILSLFLSTGLSIRLVK